MQPGTLIDRYRILERLGEGGMASVYLARHTLLGSRHAVKVLRPELVVHASLRGRFLAEGRIAAQIRHPNIVDVTDVVVAPGVAGLVMEYVDGPTLDQWIDAQAAPLSLQTLLAVAMPMLDGLGEAHAYGVVHRDLKPANVLMGTDRRGAVRPVVLDFGIAKLAEDTRVEHDTKLDTKAGTRMGTPAYMSPEQIRESANVDHRTDLFAMGAILFELATGRLAFAKDTEFDTMKAIVAGAYPDPRGIRPDLPEGLFAVIDLALAIDPADRFTSAGEMASALERLGSAGPKPDLQALVERKPVGRTATPPPPVPRWNGPYLEHGDVRYPLAQDVNTVGRAHDNQIVVDHPSVSPLHCLVGKQGSRWFVEDQRSELGTLVDGRLTLGRHLVDPGQTITLGAIDLLLRAR